MLAFYGDQSSVCG